MQCIIVKCKGKDEWFWKKNFQIKTLKILTHICIRYLESILCRTTFAATLAADLSGHLYQFRSSRDLNLFFPILSYKVAQTESNWMEK